MRNGSTCFAFLAALALLAGAIAQSEAAITVDGQWSDWGIDIADGHLVYDSAYGYIGYPAGTKDFNPPPAVIGDWWIYYDIEDSNDHASDSAPLGPLNGGQNYDAEFLGAAVDSDYLYIAIFTGQRRDNLAKRFAPGDILIKDDADNYYGIEVGGGIGGSFTGDIREGNDGTYYHIDDNGYTTDPYVTNLTGQQVAGSLWSTPGKSDTYWEHGISGAGTEPTQLIDLTPLIDPSSYTRVGVAESYYYKHSSDLAQHAFIELRVALDLFTDEVDLAGWAPVCGNDRLYLQAEIRPIPEAASFFVWALLALSFGGCGWWWRRRGR